MDKKYIHYNLDSKTLVDVDRDKTNFTTCLHFHSSYEIYLTHSGPMSCLINSEIYHLQKNDMLVFAPSDIHMSTPPKQGTYRSTVFNFSPHKVKKLSDTTDLLMPFKASVKNFSHKVSLSDKEVVEYLDMLKELKQIIKRYEHGDDVREQLMIAKILLFVDMLYRDNVKEIDYDRVDDDDITLRVLEYINSNFGDDISLSSISKKFSLSKNVLNHHFKEKNGYTVGQYIIQYRMFVARQLLEEGESVYNASWKVGYKDTSNFIRTYKKIIGTTPGAYKNSKKRVIVTHL
jgi:AraC-like DNA-binding protein